MRKKTEVLPVSEENVSLKENSFKDGSKSYSVILSSSFVDQCDIYDREWNETYRKFVASEFPYTMSPKTTKMIATLSTFLKKKMKKVGFHINPWRIDMSEEPYVISVLSKVMATEPIEPINIYTKEVALHIKFLREKSQDLPITVRSLFSGASVADKCLLITLYNMGEYVNLISCDSSADSVAIGALNLEIWNQNLPEKDRYEIHMVDGKIPKDLLLRDRVVILQVSEAMQAAKEDTKLSLKYDVLLIDNGLQYVTRNYTQELISICLNNIGQNGLYIAALGSDQGLKVEFSVLFHIVNILKALVTKDVRKSFAKDYEFTSPYGIDHKYVFRKREDGSILITGMKTEGTARMYNWLAHLILHNRKKLPEVMKAIKSATEVSRANIFAETSPFDYHKSIIDAIEEKGLKFEELAKPLNYEDFGWEKIGKDEYKKGEEVVDGGTMMQMCKEIDPLVIRISRVYVN
ncbi:MAG TPA: hypothetical protein PLG10_00725 [Candidatus Dojkabacteria bacterium]|jgi:hypothetical protein|nr:hypothetical protein [Candidatus Dojkabacteria bacterium]